MTQAQPETVGREGRPDGREAVLRMKIGGLACSFCTNTIRTTYGRIDGVHEVGVSLAHEEGLIKYDPEKVTEEQLKQTLRDVGYTYRDPDKVRSFEEEAAEVRRERNRLIVAGALTLTSFFMMLFGMWLNVVSIPLMPWVMLTLALETMFVTGWFIMRMAYQSLRRRILNQHVLLEFAAFAGLTGGLLGIFVSPGFPAGDFFAVSVFVTTYHILSHYVSLVVRTRSSQAVRRLMDLQPAVARVIRDGQELEVPIEEVVEGDRVRIRPGESVPVDGEVVEGVSAVNESLVTGEPIPTEKSPGDAVIGGSVNQNGTLVVRVTRVGEESFLSQVARSIEQARALRPGVLVLVDIILPRFVRGVLIFAAFGFIAWTAGPLLFGEGPNWFRATFAALAALVLGYPCALGMAMPLAMVRGGGEAADRGILMRSGEAFQIMRDIRTVVLDKTGTITHGEPAVQVVVPAEGHMEADVLALAASAEASSEHPLGARGGGGGHRARGRDQAVRWLPGARRLGRRGDGRRRAGARREAGLPHRTGRAAQQWRRPLQARGRAGADRDRCRARRRVRRRDRDCGHDQGGRSGSDPTDEGDGTDAGDADGRQRACGARGRDGGRHRGGARRGAPGREGGQDPGAPAPGPARDDGR